MAKPKYGTIVKYKKTYKGTSLGKKAITSTMNKKVRQGRSRKAIRASRRRSKYSETNNFIINTHYCEWLQ